MAKTRLLCKNSTIVTMSTRSGRVMGKLGRSKGLPMGMMCGKATGSSGRIRTIFGTTGGSRGYVNIVA